MTYRSYSRIGVYIDVSNIYRSGGSRMQYGVLREFAARDGGELVRLNAYTSLDVERTKVDYTYKTNVNNFYSVLRDLGYKVITKEVKWYEDEAGGRYGKANADLDLAVDMLLQSNNLDRVLLVTGDGDFTRVVRAVQNKGCRVEVMALDNVSFELRREADMFMSGYLIPNLIPTTSYQPDQPPWGAVGSRVRGVCYTHKQDYGFMRYLNEIAPGLWLTDTRRTDSPYGSVFFHDSNLPDGVDPSMLPNRNHIFEFDLMSSSRQQGFQAENIELVSVSSP
ncbi:MAG: NYN domain-containing protein [Anaerolineae bacterium]|nr:NYN domain-containing protein [Anaerolineae bacterium]